MHRCWLEMNTPPAPGDCAALSPQESDHVAKVLRMKQGDALQVIAAERLYDAAVESVSDGAVRIRITREAPSPESAVKITLWQGLPKADKLEWIVQKATELGVYSILPVEMARSVARITDKEEKKRERLRRIALEAAKQAGRSHVPAVQPAVRLESALEAAAEPIYVAWEAEDGLLLSQAVAADHPTKMTIVIGPEGGITEDEIERLKAVGAKTVSLGRRILRTETAGLCAVAAALAALGEL